MKQFQAMYIILAAVVVFFFPCYADNSEPLHLQIKQSGFVGLEAGEVVKGTDFSSSAQPIPLEHQWQQRLLFQLVNDVAVSERMRIIIALECQLNYSYPINSAWPETQVGRWSVYPDRAEATYACGDPEAPYLQLGFGYFPFRTNPDVTNLGEFLFRSGTYPLFVINNFNRPYARLLGMRATFTFFETFRQDILFTSDYALVPLQDWSLSYVASYNAFKCLDVGAGLSFAHYFPINDKITTPKDLGDVTTYPIIDENGDTSYYTFKGLKVMTRGAFDPKPLLPFLSELFGKNDLKLYSELCVVGWQDYKNYDTVKFAYQYFDNRLDRTLWMVGFNIPAFKILDVLSLEFERFPNRYPNSYQEVFNYSAPKPLDANTRSDVPSPWKWSLYAKKTFLNNFTIIGQVARDHFAFTNSNPKIQMKEDVLTQPGDMWWALRLNAKF